MKNIPQNMLASYPSTLGKDTISIPRQGVLPNQEKLIVYMKQLQDAVRSSYMPAILNYMTTVILCELHSQISASSKEGSASKKSQKQIYHDIVDYIKTNVNQPLKVADVAAYFGYNEKYLSHMFSGIAGVSLKQFILSAKVDSANFMLTDTNQSIVEIAQALGFSDSHNFAKAYKKISGITPTEYRNAFSKRMLYHV